MVLNSLFIVGFARFFQNGGKVNIIFQGPMKFGLGLTLLGLGFGFLAYGVWVLMPTQLLESVCFG
jgi:POT family proton-dependent oligopeptide transporter